MPRIHAHIEGRVQGVGFRQWACTTATRLGLTGWVQNLPDGRVELLAEGPDEPLQALLQLLAKGPPLARVTRVTHSASDLTQSEFESFEFRRYLG